ncbi:MAG: rhodanese-like domain-containing protein [Nanobdellota archaeon]
MIILLFAFFDYMYLEKINSPDNSINLEEIGVEYSPENIDPREKIKLNNESFENHRFISFGSLNNSEYDTYKKIVLSWYLKNSFFLNDSFYISFDILWSDLTNNPERFIDHLNGLNITKNDKIIIACYTGRASKIVAYLMYNLGYSKVYFSELRSIKTSDFINADYVSKTNKINNIITKRFDWESVNNYYLFLFDLDEPEIICSKKGLCKKNFVKNNIYGIKSSRFASIEMREEHPEMDIIPMKSINKTDSKFICLNTLHCLLTKHYLSSLNYSISNIYLAD